LTYFLIEADPVEGETVPTIADFDPFTLSWISASVSLAVVWSGDVPYDHQGFTSVLGAHARSGASIALFLVRTAHQDAWLDFVFQHCREDTQLFQVKEGSADIPPERLRDVFHFHRPTRRAS
jgi:hypothetical protein